MADMTRAELFSGDPEKPETLMYRDKDSGVIFREFTIDAGLGGDPVRICHITDIHFNCLTDEDRKNPELAYTETCRIWLKDGAAALSCGRAMKFSEYADATVITGDVLDFLTEGAAKLMWEHIWDKYPDTIITTGNHDYRFNMQTKRPEQVPIEKRLEIMASYWKHDPYYYSRLIKDKVLIVSLDNGRDVYSDLQAEKLQADIELARNSGYVILIFQHSPISTGKPQDEALPAVRAYDSETWDFYRAIGFEATGATARVYSLITENADVIKGIFVGHLHSAFYSEVNASYKDKDGTVQSTVIPQLTLEANVYDGQAGHVLKIEVK